MERTHTGPQRDTEEDVYHSILGGTEELGTTWVSHHRALAGCSPEVLCQEGKKRHPSQRTLLIERDLQSITLSEKDTEKGL